MRRYRYPFIFLAALFTLGAAPAEACSCGCDSSATSCCATGACAGDCAKLEAPATAPSHARAVNISTRAGVQTGDNVLIAGFIVDGSEPKRVIVRAIGPSLALPGVLADPVLELYDGVGAIGGNDSWRSTQEAEIVASQVSPTHEKEAALVRTLAPGAYTVIVRGVNNTTGIALVEVYDLDAADMPVRLANISTRGLVGADDNVMIGGFIVQHGQKRALMRARGPSLSFNGIYFANRLLNPNLTLHDGNGLIMAQNDDWRSAQEAEINASSLAPTQEAEPAVIATLPAGAYTFVVRGHSNSTGLTLVELFDLDQPPQIDGSTLYVAPLRGQSGVATGGSGSSSLRLSADETSATLFFDYTNLSAAVTSVHIHAADGTILFDPDEVQPQADGSYLWVIQPVAAYTVADILSFIKSGNTYLNVHTSTYPAGEIRGFFNFATGAQVAPAPTPAPTLPAGQPTARQAHRFLEQSTFGPTAEMVAQVQRDGFEAFLDEQFGTPASLHVPMVDAIPSTEQSLTNTMEAWWTRAVVAPDQLRQRVAFALSQILVVSARAAGLEDEAIGMAAYQDVLVRNAFGNFRQLLEEITLSPAMGIYLDMLRSQKADPRRGRIPNENYAREILQLFSIGVYRLNLDGSLTLDASGFPIETYDQNAILGLAATFTGWTFAQSNNPPVWFPTENFREPMLNIYSRHETAAKTILDGVVIPASQSADQDLDRALDTIFNHPNVGPFICRQLIQRLVTSNPSPGYVYRVASVFNNNGQGARGDLRAVIKAILLDYDARGPVDSGVGYGHLREPVLRLTSLLRAFKGSTPTGRFTITGASNLGQIPLQAPTVFNFFTPDYQAPGAVAGMRLKSPEFEITTELTVVTIANYLRGFINSGNGPTTNRTTLNLSYEQSLAGNPSQLVDHLNNLLMGGAMSPGMRTIVVNAVTNTSAANPTERVRTAIYLIVNSPEYVIQK